MSERKGFSGSADELERSLIESARLDARHAPEAIRSQILTAIGALGAVGASSAAAGAVTASGALGRLWIVKWFAATVLVGAAGFGTFEATRHVRPASNLPPRSPEPPPPAALHVGGELEMPAVAPAEALHGSVAERPDEAAGRATQPPERRRPAPRAIAAPETAEAPEVASSLQAEVAILDRARAALAAADPGRALAVLDGYQQAFPKGGLRPEATYLRIQALIKAGQRSAARDLAMRFLADHPDSPHAAQLRPLMNR